MATSATILRDLTCIKYNISSHAETAGSRSNTVTGVPAAPLPLGRAEGTDLIEDCHETT